MIRFYLVNTVLFSRNGIEVPNSNAPEHFMPLPEGVKDAAFMAFGNEGHMLVAADVTPEAHTAITALPRVTVLPEDLDTQLTAGAVTAVESALEARNIPAEWVSTSLTYREVLRCVIGIFQFAQRYNAQTGLRLFRAGVTLSTRMNQIPVARRNELSDVATSFNLDVSAVTGTTTIRQLLRLLGEQWLARPVTFGSAVV